MMLRLSSLALALVMVLPQAADAKRSKKRGKSAESACGIDYLPLVEGTVWRYQFVVPPEAQEIPGPKSAPPEEIEIKVVQVEDKGKRAEITIEESYRDVTVTSVLSCGKDFLHVPPHSFFFAGEPGGARGTTLAEPAAKGDMYPGKGGLRNGDSLYSEIESDYTREAGKDSGATHAPGRLEIERQFNVESNDPVETGLGEIKARRVVVVMSGRASVEPQIKKLVHMPETRSTLWFADDVGLVRAYNQMGYGWQLAEMSRADEAEE